MAILSFERAVNVIKEEHQILKIRVLKDGPEATDCYLTFTGTTNYSNPHSALHIVLQEVTRGYLFN